VFITDTHPLIFYATKQKGRLSKKALQIFEDCENGKNLIYIPVAVLWETSILVQKSRVKLKTENYEEWVSNLIEKPSFVLIPIELAHVFRAHQLSFNNDPFDLLIVAIAEIMDLPLITKDSIITDANIVEVVW